MTRARILHILATVTALVTAIVALLNALPSGPAPSKQHLTNVAQGNLKRRAVQATADVQREPVVACNPALGGAKLGVCGPTQALAASNALAVKAGDPFNVSGRPLGVDTSSYQPCGYSLAGLSFAAFKATEGTGYTDRCLRSNVDRAKRERKPYTVYDFLRPSFAHSATAEANHFVSAVDGARANTSMPPTADVEANAGLSTAQLNSYVCTWHNVVKRALHRNVTITYTGAWFARFPRGCGSVLWDSAYASCYLTPPAWSALHPVSTFGSCSGRGGAVIWQYSDGIYGPRPHIHGWDSDVWLGTRAQLAAFAGGGAIAAAPSKRAVADCRGVVRYRLARSRGQHPGPGATSLYRKRVKALSKHYRCGRHGSLPVLRRR